MSRIFKSNYVRVGIPKHIESKTPEIKKEEEVINIEVHQAQSLEEKANSIINEAKEMYLRIIEDANLEAKEIVEKALREKEAIHQEAAQQGYNDGYSAGYKEGINQAEDIIDQASKVKLQLDERRLQIYKEAEKEIMEMVLDISRKVIGEELTQNPDVVLSLIKQALKKSAFKDKLTIRVAEQDYEHVNANKDKIVMLTEGINELEICCDKALPKGSCIVETPSGEINSGIGVQMDEIQRAFEYLMRNE